MIPDIIRGNESRAIASKTKSWIAGYFMPPSIANTSELEVKLWRYENPFDYGKKRFEGTELIVIYGGKLRFDLEDEKGEKQTMTLDGKDVEYVILPPGITKTVVVEEVPAFGVTVRWPQYLRNEKRD